MDWTQVLWSIVVIFVLIVLGRFCYREFRKWEERYIGFGWVLGYNGDSVTVDTLLLNSPAYKGGVRHGDVIRYYNDSELAGCSVKEKHHLTRSNDLTFGDIIKVDIERNGERLPAFILAAEVIQGPIPVYDTPVKFNGDDDWRVEHGIGYCRRTGVFYATERLSEEALSRILC